MKHYQPQAFIIMLLTLISSTYLIGQQQEPLTNDRGAALEYNKIITLRPTLDTWHNKNIWTSQTETGYELLVGSDDETDLHTMGNQFMLIRSKAEPGKTGPIQYGDEIEFFSLTYNVGDGRVGIFQAAQKWHVGTSSRFGPSYHQIDIGAETQHVDGQEIFTLNNSSEQTGTVYQNDEILIISKAPSTTKDMSVFVNPDSRYGKSYFEPLLMHRPQAGSNTFFIQHTQEETLNNAAESVHKALLDSTALAINPLRYNRIIKIISKNNNATLWTHPDHPNEKIRKNKTLFEILGNGINTSNDRNGCQFFVIKNSQQENDTSPIRYGDEITVESLASFDKEQDQLVIDVLINPRKLVIADGDQKNMLLSASKDHPLFNSKQTIFTLKNPDGKVGIVDQVDTIQISARETNDVVWEDQSRFWNTTENRGSYSYQVGKPTSNELSFFTFEEIVYQNLNDDAKKIYDRILGADLLPRSISQEAALLKIADKNIVALFDIDSEKYLRTDSGIIEEPSSTIGAVGTTSLDNEAKFQIFTKLLDDGTVTFGLQSIVNKMFVTPSENPPSSLAATAPKLGPDEQFILVNGLLIKPASTDGFITIHDQQGIVRTSSKQDPGSPALQQEASRFLIEILSTEEERQFTQSATKKIKELRTQPLEQQLNELDNILTQSKGKSVPSRLKDQYTKQLNDLIEITLAQGNKEQIAQLQLLIAKVTGRDLLDEEQQQKIQSNLQSTIAAKEKMIETEIISETPILKKTIAQQQKISPGNIIALKSNITQTYIQAHAGGIEGELATQLTATAQSPDNPETLFKIITKQLSDTSIVFGLRSIATGKYVTSENWRLQAIANTFGEKEYLSLVDENLILARAPGSSGFLNQPFNDGRIRTFKKDSDPATPALKSDATTWTIELVSTAQQRTDAAALEKKLAEAMIPFIEKGTSPIDIFNTKISALDGFLGDPQITSQTIIKQTQDIYFTNLQTLFKQAITDPTIAQELSLIKQFITHLNRAIQSPLLSQEQKNEVSSSMIGQLSLNIADLAQQKTQFISGEKEENEAKLKQGNFLALKDKKSGKYLQVGGIEGQSAEIISATASSPSLPEAQFEIHEIKRIAQPVAFALKSVTTQKFVSFYTDPPWRLSASSNTANKGTLFTLEGGFYLRSEHTTGFLHVTGTGQVHTSIDKKNPAKRDEASPLIFEIVSTQTKRSFSEVIQQQLDQVKTETTPGRQIRILEDMISQFTGEPLLNAVQQSYISLLQSIEKSLPAEEASERVLRNFKELLSKILQQNILSIIDSEAKQQLVTTTTNKLESIALQKELSSIARQTPERKLRLLISFVEKLTPELVSYIKQTLSEQLTSLIADLPDTEENLTAFSRLIAKAQGINLIDYQKAQTLTPQLEKQKNTRMVITQINTLPRNFTEQINKLSEIAQQPRVVLKRAHDAYYTKLQQLWRMMPADSRAMQLFADHLALSLSSNLLNQEQKNRILSLRDDMHDAIDKQIIREDSNRFMEQLNEIDKEDSVENQINILAQLIEQFLDRGITPSAKEAYATQLNNLWKQVENITNINTLRAFETLLERSTEETSTLLTVRQKIAISDTILKGIVSLIENLDTIDITKEETDDIKEIITVQEPEKPITVETTPKKDVEEKPTLLEEKEEPIETPTPPEKAEEPIIETIAPPIEKPKEVPVPAEPEPTFPGLNIISARWGDLNAPQADAKWVNISDKVIVGDRIDIPAGYQEKINRWDHVAHGVQKGLEIFAEYQGAAYYFRGNEAEAVTFPTSFTKITITPKDKTKPFTLKGAWFGNMNAISGSTEVKNVTEIINQSKDGRIKFSQTGLQIDGDFNKVDIFGDPKWGWFKGVTIFYLLDNKLNILYSTENAAVNLGRPPTFPGLNIISARWGDLNAPQADRRWTDITGQVIVGDRIDIPTGWDPKVKLWGDPAPGVQKGLEIFAEYQGAAYYFRGNEAEAVTFPNSFTPITITPAELAQPFVLKGAWFGNMNAVSGSTEVKDVTSLITQSKDGRIKFSQTGLQIDGDFNKVDIFGDPKWGWFKGVTIFYLLDNKLNILYSTENAAVNLGRPPTFPGLNIISARWGDLNAPQADRRWTDITGQVIVGDRIDIPTGWDPKVKLWGDPAPGVQKGLEIFAEYQGAAYYFRGNEAEAVTFPNSFTKITITPEELAQPFTLKGAWFGNMNAVSGSNEVNDSTSLIRQSKDGRIKFSQTGLQIDGGFNKADIFGDPKWGWFKGMTIIYLLDGKLNILYATENSEINLGKPPTFPGLNIISARWGDLNAPQADAKWVNISDKVIVGDRIDIPAGWNPKVQLWGNPVPTIQKGLEIFAEYQGSAYYFRGNEAEAVTFPNRFTKITITPEELAQPFTLKGAWFGNLNATSGSAEVKDVTSLITQSKDGRIKFSQTGLQIDGDFNKADIFGDPKLGWFKGMTIFYLLDGKLNILYTTENAAVNLGRPPTFPGLNIISARWGDLNAPQADRRWTTITGQVIVGDRIDIPAGYQEKINRWDDVAHGVQKGLEIFAEYQGTAYYFRGNEAEAVTFPTSFTKITITPAELAQPFTLKGAWFGNMNAVSGSNEVKNVTDIIKKSTNERIKLSQTGLQIDGGFNKADIFGDPKPWWFKGITFFYLSNGKPKVSHETENSQVNIK